MTYGDVRSKSGRLRQRVTERQSLPGSVCRANNLPPYFGPSETEKNGDPADWVRGDVRAPSLHLMSAGGRLQR